MTHLEARKEALYFHAQTLNSLGEDVDNCFLKPVLEGGKRDIGDGRYIFLFNNELAAMSKTESAYFEFYKKEKGIDHWEPKSTTRDLYKLVHNGHPEEYAIPTDDDKCAIPVEDLVLVMSYTPSKVDLDAFVPQRTVEKPEKFSQGSLNFSSLSSIFDKPLMEVTLGEFIEALKTLK